MSGEITYTPDLTLTDSERITNAKINRVGGGSWKVQANSIGEDELSTAIVGGFSTVTALRANTDAQTDGQRIPVKGYRSADDGNFGPDLFVDTSDTTTADDGLSCFVDVNGVRYKRVFDSNTINIKWAGAYGDGTTADDTYINAAMAYLNANQGTLFFSEGTYRFTSVIGTSTTQGALNITSSNVEIIFEAGATLLLDNQSSNAAGSDGISIQEGLENIRISYPRIKWNSKPSSRNERSGIAAYGYPSETDVGGYKCIQNVLIESPYIENSGGTGLIFHGCQDITVNGTTTVKESQADGVHFNYCRRCHVDNIRGINTGDDTLAFVNYYHASNVWDAGTAGNYPLNASAFGDWNCNGSFVGSVYTEGGSANGVRFAGATDVVVGSVHADGKSTGVKADSAITDGGSIAWTYYASRRCEIKNIYAVDCDTGFLMDTLNCDETDGGSYFNFDMRVGKIHAKNCTNDGLFMRDCLGLDVDHAILEGCDLRFQEKCRTVYFRRLESNQRIAMYGLDAGEMDPSSYDTDHDLRFDSIQVFDGSNSDPEYFLVENYQGLSVGTLEINNVDGGGVQLKNCRNVDIDNLIIRDYNNADSATAAHTRACFLDRCHNVKVNQYLLDFENQTNIVTLEIGGGDATAVCENILFPHIQVVSERSSSSALTTIQAGTYAPLNLSYFMWFKHGTNDPDTERVGDNFALWGQQGYQEMASGGSNTLDIDDLVIGEMGACIVTAQMYGPNHVLSYMFAVVTTNTTGITVATLASDIHSANGSIAITGGTSNTSQNIKITYTRNGASSTDAMDCKYRIIPTHNLYDIT